MKGLIYTAIFGGRDRPRPVVVPEANVDYLMFTDGAVAKGWKGVRVAGKPNPRLAARLLKIPLPPQAGGYDWAVWVDGSHVPHVPITRHVEKWLKDKDFAAYRHPQRSCTYQEIEACRVLKKDRPERLASIKKELERERFPKGYGLIASGVLVRRVSSEIVKRHARLWKRCVENYSVRDQLSFMFCLWQVSEYASAEYNLHYIPGNVYGSELFKFYGAH